MQGEWRGSGVRGHERNEEVLPSIENMESKGKEGRGRTD